MLLINGTVWEKPLKVIEFSSFHVSLTSCTSWHQGWIYYCPECLEIFTANVIVEVPWSNKTNNLETSKIHMDWSRQMKPHIEFPSKNVFMEYMTGDKLRSPFFQNWVMTSQENIPSAFILKELRACCFRIRLWTLAKSSTANDSCRWYHEGSPVFSFCFYICKHGFESCD